jgi:hypothetical protein
MTIYAIRKSHGKWTVFSKAEKVMEFDSYEEAFNTAQRAARVVTERHGANAKTVDGDVEQRGYP